MDSSLRTRIADLGLQLPDSPAPRGKYDSITVHNGIGYISGQVSRLGDQVIAGLANDNTPDEILRQASEACVLRALSVLAGIETQYTVERVLFLRGFVNAAPNFSLHSSLLDHASNLLHAVFGDRGRHSRTAVGAGSLPGMGLLEIELVVALSATSGTNTDLRTDRNT